VYRKPRESRKHKINSAYQKSNLQFSEWTNTTTLKSEKFKCSEVLNINNNTQYGVLFDTEHIFLKFYIFVSAVSEQWISTLQNQHCQNIGSHNYKTGTVRTLDLTIRKLALSEQWISPLQNQHCQNNGSHYYKTGNVRTMDLTITKLALSECNDSQNIMDCMKMGVRAQTDTKWQTSLFYSAVSMSQKIIS